jgi:hypothetical protein
MQTDANAPEGDTMRAVVLLTLAMMSSAAIAKDPDVGIVPEFIGAWDPVPSSNCVRALGETHDRYGLALATLYSLSYAKTAIDRSAEIKPAMEGVQNMTDLMTRLLRVTKQQSADFSCSQLMLASFNQPSNDPLIRIAAQNLIFKYHRHILLNNRLNIVTKELESIKPAKYADTMSTIQVERELLCKSMWNTIDFVSLNLVDYKRTNAKKESWYLLINKSQKSRTISIVREWFPEAFKHDLKNMDEATYDASLYVTFMNSHKASDEI